VGRAAIAVVACHRSARLRTCGRASRSCAATAKIFYRFFFRVFARRIVGLAAGFSPALAGFPGCQCAAHCGACFMRQCLGRLAVASRAAVWGQAEEGAGCPSVAR
jgi:hypothetical protein